MANFGNWDMKRLLELAGVEQSVDDAAGAPDVGSTHDVSKPISSKPTSMNTEKHLGKETDVFDHVRDSLDELLDFLQNQEGFEARRGKEQEYEQMEHDATELKAQMEKHLSEYSSDDEDMESDDNDELEFDTDVDGQDDYVDVGQRPMGEGLLFEKWKKSAKVKHTGKNTKQSVETLRKEARSAKKAGDTKKARQKEFAIRAKTGWGKTGV